MNSGNFILKRIYTRNKMIFMALVSQLHFVISCSIYHVGDEIAHRVGDHCDVHFSNRASISRRVLEVFLSACSAHPCVSGDPLQKDSNCLIFSISASTDLQ